MDQAQRFAVVMNNRARKVKAHTIEMVARHVPDEDLFVTQTVEQSDACLEEIIEKKYPLVFCGGGDGTAMRIIEQMFRHVKRRIADGREAVMPRIGLLKLGTGNGWAGQLKVPPKTDPIDRLKRGAPSRFTRFSMLQVGDRLAHMGGLGIDAAVLNDYITLKNRHHEGWRWKFANSMWGYIYAIVFVSIPYFFRHGSQWNVRVYNDSDDPVFQAAIGEQPTRLGLRRGDLIFEGPLRFVGFATTMNYGFNLKVFPFAGTMPPGYLQLRLVSTSIPGLIARVPQVWTGTIRHPGVRDYLLTRVRIESDHDIPFQLGGDPEGQVRSVTVGVAQETVEVLDFS